MDMSKRKNLFINYISTHKTLFWVAIFAIAMGYLEAIVVIYLRELYYPDGFRFPLSIAMNRIVGIEWLREIATIVMLFTVAVISGRSRTEKLFYFLYCFGIWDIFYYIALKHLIDWPESFFTFDILFLIPVTWIGPVIAPVICSTIFIVFSFIVITKSDRGVEIRSIRWQWILFSAGNLLVFIAFIWDFGSMIVLNGFLDKLTQLASDDLFQKLVRSYVPHHFRWELFAIGESLVIVALTTTILKIRKGD